MAAWNGVLPVDKPVGPTSHDAVAAVRRALGTRQVGHTGTLDPFASGLLLVCLGPSTRLAEYLTGLPKRYAATLRLGEATDSDDHTGQVISRSAAWESLEPARVRAALESQIGTLRQLPPRYSAKKVEGERMYAAARRGDEVARTPVEVTVYALRVTWLALPEVDFEVECGAGTYIRAIARDAGEALGVGAHLTALRRTAVGTHTVDGAVPLDALADHERVRGALLTPLAAVSHLPRITVAGDEVAALRHGRALLADEATPQHTPLALASAEGALLAIGERDGELVRPRKVFAAGE